MFRIHEALRMKSLWGMEDGDMLMVEMWNVKCAEQERGSNMSFPKKYFFVQSIVHFSCLFAHLTRHLLAMRVFVTQHSVCITLDGAEHVHLYTCSARSEI